MDLTPLEIDYSPSRWTKRGGHEEIIAYYQQYLAKESELVRNKIPSTLNVVYGNRQREKLDIFGTNLPKDAPVFIFIHGGYWQDFSKEVSCHMAENFMKNGIKTIVIGFELCPNVTLAELIESIKIGVKKSLELAESWGSRKCILAGHSSGAHLVACLLDDFFLQLSETNRQLLTDLILISGIYNIVPIVDVYANDLIKLDKNEAKRLSPFHNDIKTTGLNIIFIVPEHESPIFKKESEMLNEKINATNNRTSITYVANTDHFDIIENLTDANFELSKMIFNLALN